MAEDSLFLRDRQRELSALARAKEKNAAKTIPIRIRDGIVYITPQQAADENYMKRLKENYEL